MPTPLPHRHAAGDAAGSGASASWTFEGLPGITLFERGWLSSNNILLTDTACAALVDSGYQTDAAATVELVQNALGSRPLDLLVNTHLHADHCGGNARLLRAYSSRLALPANAMAMASNWQEEVLPFRSLGQRCEPFAVPADTTLALRAGQSLRLADLDWQVLDAPGHIAESVMLYAPRAGLLISADALWENGFGAIFPEVEQQSGFAEQRAVLDLIRSLDVYCVLPGHGRPFTDVSRALDNAYARLQYLASEPARNARQALKVLIAFRLMSSAPMSEAQLFTVMSEARTWRAAAATLAPESAWHDLLDGTLGDLLRAGAIRREGALLAA
ncbi:MAG: MBL fold metallo-hydrolase [Janthinobacterium lividum]